MKNIKKQILALAFIACLSSPLPAQDAETAFLNLYEEYETENGWLEAVTAAETEGVDARVIAEAKMHHYMETEDHMALYEMRKELKTISIDWETEQSMTNTADEAEVLSLYATALGASAAKDDELFEQSIKEAFWSAPEFAEVLGELVKDHRSHPESDSIIQKLLEAVEGDDLVALENAAKDAFWVAPEYAEDLGQIVASYKEEREKARIMENLIIPLDIELMISDGGTVKLSDLLGDSEALYLDFWASWCGPCMVRMNTLNARGPVLGEHGIFTAGINIEHDPAIAEKVRKSKGMNDVAWLVEPAEEPLQSILDVDSIPTVWIVTKEGKLIYNGHPDDEKLRELLLTEYDVVLPPDQK